jgi:hypothetical protein
MSIKLRGKLGIKRVVGFVFIGAFEVSSVVW